MVVVDGGAGQSSAGGGRRMKGGRIGVGGNAGALALDYAFDRR